jgi:hypothetical protein
MCLTLNESRYTFRNGNRRWLFRDEMNGLAMVPCGAVQRARSGIMRWRR